MAIIIPLPTDTLGADGHAAMHSVVAVDITAPQQSIAVPASGNVGVNISTPTAKLTVAGNLATVPVALTAGTGIVISGSASNMFTLTPGTNSTITATSFVAGQNVNLIVLTSGSSSDTLTFSTGIRTAFPTLTTGTQSGKYFIVEYVSDGTNLIESSRTVAS